MIFVVSRPYQLKQRADRQAETRQRIIEATIELHQTIGPAATTITEIAERAGVGRVTVYRHFPEELSLDRACSGLYFERNPAPDPAGWRTVADPVGRLRRGLQETYAYHARTEQMISHALADARDHPVMAPYHAHWARAARVLLEPWPASGRRRRQLRAALVLVAELRHLADAGARSAPLSAAGDRVGRAPRSRALGSAQIRPRASKIRSPGGRTCAALRCSLGRLPPQDRLPRRARPDPRNLAASRYLDLAALPTPPTTWSRISQRVSTLPMYANNRLNDCTTAAVGHKIMAASGWAGHLHQPTEAAVVALYWATGKNDDGRYPNTVLNAWRTATGDLGAHRPEAYVVVDHDDAAMLRTAAYLFAGVYVCANLPVNLKQQLAANKTTWSYVAGAGSAPGSWDGHAFVATGYFANGDWDIRSWGRRFRVTKRWMQQYVYLAFAILSTRRAAAREREEPAGHRPGDPARRPRAALTGASGGPLPQLRGVLLRLLAPALVGRLVHAADGDELVMELDKGVRVARAEHVLAEPTACGGGTGLTALCLGLLGLFWRCGRNAELVSGIVSRIVATRNYHHPSGMPHAKTSGPPGRVRRDALASRPCPGTRRRAPGSAFAR